MKVFGFPSYRDERTGVLVRDLTPGPGRDQSIYQTHPMWTPGMDYFVFHSDRTGDQWPHALKLESGKIHPLVDRECGMIVLARKDDRLYFVSGSDMWVTRVREAFQDPSRAERVAGFPAGVMRLEGSLTLDADEKTLYAGALIEEDKKWALLALDLASGTWRTVVDLDFRIGHVQANPTRSGVIMFCHETGGESPQRMWVVNGDGSGMRPFYKETYNEWVTHEVWWGPDRAIFTIWPYDEEHKQKPHGIASADLATGALTIHSQYPAWHTNGSPDGQWAVGDDFERNVWLVKIATGERRLLTQGHNGEGFQTHPHPSFTPDGKGVVFNSSRNGTEDLFLADMPEDWEALPLAEK